MVSKNLLKLVALASFGVGALHAQDVSRVTGTADTANRSREVVSPQKKDDEKTKIPTLYDGEVEDVGPQLLLLEAPPHDWFQALADLQNYYTSNATLVESDRTWSDVTVLTAQAGVNAKPISVGSGKIAFSSGYRYQKFNYGLVSFRTNHDIAGGVGKIDSLDFDTHTGFLNAEWTQGGWAAGVSGRYTAYIASNTDKTTYQEWVPSVHGGYRFTLSERDFLSVDGDVSYRISHTYVIPALGNLFGFDYNNRADLGLNVAYTHIFGERLLLQPSYRFQYSRYTEGSSSIQTGPGREDFFHIFTLTTGYYFNQNFSVRLFASAEIRDSSEPFVADYRTFNVGGGAMASITF